MKKTWSKPVIAAEEFVANEYVATCIGFTKTGYVVRVSTLPTDGKCDKASTYKEKGYCRNIWNNKGFFDDGFDYLSGGEDQRGKNSAGYPVSGWYHTGKTGTIIKSGNCGPVSEVGNLAHQKNKDVLRDAYYIGEQDYTIIDSSTCNGFGVGPNAS